LLGDTRGAHHDCFFGPDYFIPEECERRGGPVGVGLVARASSGKLRRQLNQFFAVQ
jgi:hypothetical protein